MRMRQLLILFGFVVTMDLALVSLGIQQSGIHKDVDQLNSDLERTNRSLERIEKNFDQIQRNVDGLQHDLQGIQGPRWTCVPGMSVDASGSETCVWVDRQSRDGG